jgi:glycosyltransferase involved in cell wall biosynthesis
MSAELLTSPNAETFSASSHPLEAHENRRSDTVATRVLHLINGEHFSGAERVQDLLALQLPACGYEVSFACVKPGQFPQMRRSTCPLYPLLMRGRFDLTAVRRLVQLVRTERFKLLHAHTPRTVLVGRLTSLVSGIPLVYHVHSPTARDSTRKWINRCNTWAERLSLIGRVPLIPVSESLGRFMKESGYPSARLHVVPNGVPMLAERPRRNLPTGRWTLGAVALFRPRKGMEVLLAALAELLQTGDDVRLLAVGGFETSAYETEIRRLAEQLGVSQQIEWTGFTRDVAQQLNRMDVMVLPSLFGEGLPMVVLEAMAAGVPVVGTCVEGVPEAIRDGLDGTLAEPGNAKDLARAIRRITRGELSWTSLSDSAFERQRESFSDRAMAHGVAEVYRQILTANS